MLLALPLLIVASAFFSGTETALFSLSHHQRLQLSRSAKLSENTLASLLAKPREVLITLLVTNVTVNVTYFVISTVLLIRLRQEHQFGAATVGVFTLLPLIVLILLGEIAPKLLASRQAMAWSRLTALPMMLVHQALAPLRIVFSTLIIAPLARLIAPPSKPPGLSAKELETILELSRQRGVIDHEEEHMLQQVLELGQLKVRDLMTPRVDIHAFNISQNPTQLPALIGRCRASRIPVYRDNLDHIQGIVLTRQVLLNPPRTQADLSQLIRQVVYVPELQRADHLLVQFRKTGTTFAIAVDEYGGTAGLITLEDVVEQMVGQIAGPHEAPTEQLVQQIQPGQWRVNGDLSIHEWADALSQQIGFGNVSGTTAIGTSGVSTLGGFVMAQLGRLPQAGDTITAGNVTMTVQTMQARRIEWLTIRLTDPPRHGEKTPHTTDTPQGGHR